ncbi:MAG: AIPR family protein [Limnobacter sp.]|nr:AIPR family protein [Limnobacter sp.]
MQYETFLSILDRLRAEAPDALAKKYRPDPLDVEKVNQARARAFIHLYLKVMFGLAEFAHRERTITDASGDGGIDGYFIDTEARTIHLIQSKFRTTQKNFENKEIAIEELLAMDINRILDGEKTSEDGAPYNGKILQLQREVSALPDVARYVYRVVILANLTGISSSKLRQLTGGYPPEIFDFEKTYKRLVFPVLTGMYFAASDIVIPVDLSNKNAGSKISYNVRTKYSDCEITVLFVPTLEIAKVMGKYKNTILKYNPRSYLDLEGQSVNTAIKNTILETETNEFALFNNGITMLSEETNINEKIGQKNKAQLRVKNPQIINGGQTSFTLSRIYADNLDKAEEVFRDKEVLLKIITLLDNDSEAAKLELIDEISNATNKQTPVITADRFANEVFHAELQHRVFERHGLLYERKRGEFSDGIKDGYISLTDVIERNHFWRLFYAANGKINRGFQKKLFQKNDFSDVQPIETAALDRVFLGVHVFRRLSKDLRPSVKIQKDTYGRVFAYIELFLGAGLLVDTATIDNNLSRLESEWTAFVELQRKKKGPGRRAYIDKASGEAKVSFSEWNYYKSFNFERDLIEFFRSAGRQAV